MILVCGVEGVGKDQYSEILQLKYGYRNILVTSLCELKESHIVRKHSLDYFRNMSIREIHLIECSPEELMEQKRSKVLDISKLNGLMDEERTYAIELAEFYGIDIRKIDRSASNKRNIILPIAPRFNDLILEGKKKYEYRKKLCKEDIRRIYLYSTAPVKGLVGEASVIEKIGAEKNELWDQSYSYSGITNDFFMKYFGKAEVAYAYKLGDIVKYENVIPLKKIGINYVIQSFTYIYDI